MPIEMTTGLFYKSYWNYYLELEEQFQLTQKYVTFDQLNFRTFSVEYIKLLQAVCSEIDVVAKEIALFFEPGFENEKNPNIQRWGYILQNRMSSIISTTIIFNDEIRVCPWKGFGYEKYVASKGSTRYRLKPGCSTLGWWKDYNEIKHKRTSIGVSGNANYTKANLRNMILAYAALFTLESQFAEHLVSQGQLDLSMFESQLFHYNSAHSEMVSLP